LEDVYYFPRETGEKLYNNVVAGRVEGAQEIIKNLYTANFERNTRLLSVKAIEIIKSRVRDSVIAIAEKYDICVDSKMLILHDESNIKKYFEIVCEVMEILSGEIKKQEALPQNNTVQKIMNYIQGNFCDSTLSLKQISQQLGLHETYISKLFKEEYGENLSVVIERLRIEKAAILIKNTELKISDIAEQVGYTSDLSFRRAFKKMTGVTPGEYREC
jgi:YesN/AraC family two-component response regulator